MGKGNDQTVAHRAADVVDNVADGIRSAAHDVGGTARDAASRVVSAVEGGYDEVGQYARDSFDRTRARARSYENSFECCVRDNPKTSLLIAAALGALLFAWWKH